jgi:hypothetical protein
MKEQYTALRFKKSSLKLIQTINDVIDDYRSQGFVLTVRQLYYQLVTQNIIKNDEKNYKSVTSLVNDARVAGLIDWDMIEDRTRSFSSRGAWTSPASILEESANIFHMDMWENQDSRVFCIVEKEALVSVLERTCFKFDVPILAARGYPSASVLREFADTKVMTFSEDQKVVILHLGDHDPSGIDMSRDLEERIALFSRSSPVEFKRIALNKDQIDDQKPPPNPAKSSDSRFSAYKREFGDSSWELDALKPSYLEKLLREQIKEHIDDGLWKERKDEIQDYRNQLTNFAATFK